MRNARLRYLPMVGPFTCDYRPLVRSRVEGCLTLNALQAQGVAICRGRTAVSFNHFRHSTSSTQLFCFMLQYSDEPKDQTQR